MGKEIDELCKIKLREEIIDEVIKWSKRKVQLIILGTTLFGALGLTAYTITLYDKYFRKQVANLQLKVEIADTDLQKHRNLSLELEEKLKILEDKTFKLDQDLGFYQAEFGDLVDKTREKDNSSEITNSSYTILVFSIYEEKTNSTNISNKFKELDFRSSSTVTNFTELNRLYPSKTIVVNYKVIDNIIKEGVEKILNEYNQDFNIIYSSNATFKNGDVQIYIF